MTKDEERIEKRIWKPSKNDPWITRLQAYDFEIGSRKGEPRSTNSWTCWRDDVFLAITLSWEGKKYRKGSEANRGERITGVIAGDEANAERERERIGGGVAGVYIAPVPRCYTTRPRVFVFCTNARVDVKLCTLGGERFENDGWWRSRQTLIVVSRLLE